MPQVTLCLNGLTLTLTLSMPHGQVIVCLNGTKAFSSPRMGLTIRVGETITKNRVPPLATALQLPCCTSRLVALHLPPPRALRACTGCRH